MWLWLASLVIATKNSGHENQACHGTLVREWVRTILRNQSWIVFDYNVPVLSPNVDYWSCNVTDLHERTLCRHQNSKVSLLTKNKYELIAREYTGINALFHSMFHSNDPKVHLRLGHVARSKPMSRWEGGRRWDFETAHELGAEMRESWLFPVEVRVRE